MACLISYTGKIAMITFSFFTSTFPCSLREHELLVARGLGKAQWRIYNKNNKNDTQRKAKDKNE